MRWVFVGIVLLNVLYLGWSLVPGEQGAASTGAPNLSEARQYPMELRLHDPAKVGVGPGVPGSRVPAPLAGCPSVGPIAEEGSAAEMVRTLAASGVPAVVQRAEGEGVPVYWVHLSPLDGRQQALRKLRELHAAGIDSFIVGEGPDANAISLGTFSVRDSAIGLQSRLRAAGYSAQIREQLKAASKFWVVIADPSAQGFLEFIPRQPVAAVSLERRPCPATL